MNTPFPNRFPHLATRQGGPYLQEICQSVVLPENRRSCKKFGVSRAASPVLARFHSQYLCYQTRKKRHHYVESGCFPQIFTAGDRKTRLRHTCRCSARPAGVVKPDGREAWNVYQHGLADRGRAVLWRARGQDVHATVNCPKVSEGWRPRRHDIRRENLVDQPLPCSGTGKPSSARTFFMSSQTRRRFSGV